VIAKRQTARAREASHGTNVRACRFFLQTKGCGRI
jgi:hypothetical protein